jgi:hypothetical protein
MTVDYSDRKSVSPPLHPRFECWDATGMTLDLIFKPSNAASEPARPESGLADAQNVTSKTTFEPANLKFMPTNLACRRWEMISRPWGTTSQHRKMII